MRIDNGHDDFIERLDAVIAFAHRSENSVEEGSVAGLGLELGGVVGLLWIGCDGDWYLLLLDRRGEVGREIVIGIEIDFSLLRRRQQREQQQKSSHNDGTNPHG